MRLNNLLNEHGGDDIYVGQGMSADQRKVMNVDLQYYRDIQGWPDTVGKLVASRCGLTSLEGSPTHVHQYFKVNQNPLGDLKGGPKVVEEMFLAKNCQLTSIEGAPDKCGTFNVSDNKIESLQGIGKNFVKEAAQLTIMNNPTLKSHILGVLLIRGLQGLSFTPEQVPAFGTILLHLVRQRDIIDCKEELIANGYKEYAKL